MIEQVRLWPGATHTLFLVLLTLEFPRVNVVIEGPDTPPIPLGIIERFEVTGIRLVPIQNPSPAVEDHFKLNVPHRASSFVVGKVRHANDATVPINHAPSVHFEEHDQFDPPVGYQRREKGLGIFSAGLLKFGCVGKSETNYDFARLLQLRVPKHRFEAVAVEDLQYRRTNGFSSRLFIRDQHSSPLPAGPAYS